MKAVVLLLVAAGSQALVYTGLNHLTSVAVAPAAAQVTTIPIHPAVVLASHYQSHVYHPPTLRRVRNLDYFDPTIPAFQTSLYAPAAHHVPILAVDSHQSHVITGAPVASNQIGFASVLPIGNHALSRTIRSVVAVQPIVTNQQVVASPVVSHTHIAHIPEEYVSTGAGVSSVTFTKAMQGYTYSLHAAPLTGYVGPSIYGFRYGGTPQVVASTIVARKKA